jgi:hypothetical protein
MNESSKQQHQQPNTRHHTTEEEATTPLYRAVAAHPPTNTTSSSSPLPAGPSHIRGWDRDEAEQAKQAESHEPTTAAKAKGRGGVAGGGDETRPLEQSKAAGLQLERDKTPTERGRVWATGWRGGAARSRRLSQAALPGRRRARRRRRRARTRFGTPAHPPPFSPPPPPLPERAACALVWFSCSQTVAATEAETDAVK